MARVAAAAGASAGASLASDGAAVEARQARSSEVKAAGSAAASSGWEAGSCSSGMGVSRGRGAEERVGWLRRCGAERPKRRTCAGGTSIAGSVAAESLSEVLRLRKSAKRLRRGGCAGRGGLGEAGGDSERRRRSGGGAGPWRVEHRAAPASKGATRAAGARTRPACETATNLLRRAGGAGPVASQQRHRYGRADCEGLWPGVSAWTNLRFGAGGLAAQRCPTPRGMPCKGTGRR